jgi:Family of unknown function (DUF6064)
MSEWWTYSLSDLLMFSNRTYYRLFELYNRAIWPTHLIAGAVGIAILACATRGGAACGRAAAGMLAACWLWVAWAFHAQRYATINSAAHYFAIGFTLEALLLLWAGMLRGRLALKPIHSGSDRAALGLLLFALLGYPLLAAAGKHGWRQMELFGVAPDPTALATLGLLLLSARAPWLLLPIPLLWCAISGATLWTMHASDAWVAPLGALLALLLFAGKAYARRVGQLDAGGRVAPPDR